jgi:hypothetical protein
MQYAQYLVPMAAHAGYKRAQQGARAGELATHGKGLTIHRAGSGGAERKVCTSDLLCVLAAYNDT